jgi:hypothetical protein
MIIIKAIFWFAAFMLYCAAGSAALLAFGLWIMWIFSPGNGLWAMLTFAGVAVYLVNEGIKKQ